MAILVRKLGLACLVTSLGMVSLCGCVYRLSNLHKRAPAQARTIAVEAVYDTARKALPHEVLWEELQKQIAILGVVTLAPRAHADLYLRAHIKDAKTQPTRLEVNEFKEPALSDGATKPSAWPSYQRATTYAQSERLTLAVHVEVWDLRHKQMLFSHSYGGSSEYKVLNEDSAVEYGFLKADEAFAKGFQEVAEKIAKKIVDDVFVHQSAFN